MAESKPRNEVKIADEMIREELSRMLESPIFVQSDRLARFLRFTVETTLAGHYRPGSYVPAFRRRDSQEGGGLATDRALRELLTEGLLAKALEVPPVSREINLQTVFEGTVRVVRLRAESRGPTESRSGRSVAKRIQLRKVVGMSLTKADQD